MTTTPHRQGTMLRHQDRGHCYNDHFCPFSAKKMAIFLKTNAMITFGQKMAVLKIIRIL
jgi:hypothetical protein